MDGKYNFPEILPREMQTNGTQMCYINAHKHQISKANSRRLLSTPLLNRPTTITVMEKHRIR